MNKHLLNRRQFSARCVAFGLVVSRLECNDCGASQLHRFLALARRRSLLRVP